MTNFPKASVSVGGEIRIIVNVNALRNYLPYRLRDGHSVIVSGQIAPGDANGGVYVWSDSSTAPDDGLKVIRPIKGLDAGRWLMAVGAGAGIPGPAGPAGPVGEVGAIGVSQAVALGDWASLSNLHRKIQNAEFNKGTQTIKIAGIGSSNMLNEGGGLSGPGNSPVEVLLRVLKQELDPLDFANWDFRNFGVNGSAIVSWGFAENGNPKSPKEYVEEYRPDVLMLCYGTNDYAPESFNSGQSRTNVEAQLAAIAQWASKLDIDVVNLIPPQPHVQRSLQTFTDPSDNVAKRGRALHFGIGQAYPHPSFAAGQQPGFKTFTFTANTITSSEPGLFKNVAAYGVGIEAGRVISVTNPVFAETTNFGYYRIASVDAAGTTITVGNKLDVGADFIVDIGPANLTPLTNAQVMVRRVAIDPWTELFPSFTQGVGIIDIEGVPVSVLTRATMVNEDMRKTAARSDYAISTVDAESYYLKALTTQSEDVFYATQEVVHWNAKAVSDVIEPAVRDFVRSLANYKRVTSGGEPTYTRELIARPNATPNAARTELKATDAIDLQIERDKRAVIRGSNGNIIVEFKDNGEVIHHKMWNGYESFEFASQRLVNTSANTANPMDTVITLTGGFYGYVYGQQPGSGVHMKRISGVFDGTTIFLYQQDEAVSQAANIIAVSVFEGNKIRVTPSFGGTQMWIDITCNPTTYGTPQV